MRIAGQTIETADDVQRICDDGWQEGQQLEFKREDGDDGRSITAEVVALANHLGGHVIVGIDETTAKPPRGGAVTPVADCAKASTNLSRKLWDQIDPPIRGIRCEPIITDDPTGAGVIMVEVPQSLFGPHRSKFDREVYQKNGEEKRRLNMTEIHRLVLAFEKREDRVEKRFAILRAPPANLVHGFSGQFLVRAAGVPLGDLSVDLALFPTPWLAPCAVRSANIEKQFRMDLSLGDFRPSLRSRVSRLDRPTVSRAVILCEDGSAQYHYGIPQTQGAAPSTVSLLGTIFSLLTLQDQIAERADYPGGEFGIEIEASWARGCEIQLMTLHHGQGYRLGDGNPGIQFPPYRYKVGDDKLVLIQRFWRDLWNVLGKEPPETIDAINAPKS